MRHRHIKPLSRQAQLDLQIMYRFHPPHESRRAHAILLSGLGYSVQPISAMVGCWAKTVRVWFDQFESEGVPGLEEAPHPGRPRKLTDKVKEELTESVHREPATFGYSQNNWTLEQLQRHIRWPCGVRLSLSSVHNGLREEGIRWRTAKGKRTSPDPDYEKKARRVRRVKKNPQPRVAVLFEDETDIPLNPDIGRGWMSKGAQQKVLTPGQNEKQYLFGAVNWKTGELWHLFRKHKTAVDYLEFLFRIEWRLEADKILWITDNFSIHKTSLIQEFFPYQPRFQCIALPTYSPWLNYIERFWKHLRARVTINRFYPSMHKLRERVHRFYQYYRRRPDWVRSIIGAATG